SCPRALRPYEGDVRPADALRSAARPACGHGLPPRVHLAGRGGRAAGLAGDAALRALPVPRLRRPPARGLVRLALRLLADTAGEGRRPPRPARTAEGPRRSLRGPRPRRTRPGAGQRVPARRADRLAPRPPGVRQ